KKKKKFYFIRVYTHFPLGFFLHTIRSIKTDPIAILIDEKTSWSEEQPVPGPAATTGRIVTNVARHAPDGQ
ncbi:hypothetical protein, partial [Aeromonas caviae]|uniref:hypothetical protein n=1 Tax=Aeromonas caviae TaxID=648 RepID=UPI002B45A67E